MDLLSFKTSLEKTENYFFNGKYTKFRGRMGQIKEQASDPTLSEQLGMDASALTSIFENNLLVCECLVLKWNADIPKRILDQILSRFLSLHQRVANFQLKVMSHEFHLWLNIVHNYLFWNWINSQALRRNECHVEQSLQLVIKCFHFVLDFFNRSCLAVKNVNSKMIALHLMKLSLAHNILLCTEGVYSIGLQLLEIYFLATQVIIESYKDTSDKEDIKSLECCADFIKTVVKLKPSFETCLQTINREENAGIKISQFKFGVHQINSRVGDSDADAIFTALCFSGSLCHLKLEQYKPSLMLLSQPTTYNNDEKPSFICNYLKSYIYYRLNDFEKSLLFLKKILDSTLNCVMGRVILLHGLILSRQGQFLKAQDEFHKVQEMESYLPLALYHSAFNYEAYAQSHRNEGEVSLRSGGQSKDCTKRSRESVPIVELPIVALKALVRSLQNEHNATVMINNYCASLELKFLSVLHPESEVTLLHAVYLLARALAKCGRFSDSADKLLYTLTVQHQTHSKQLGLVPFPPVPPIRTLMHETIAVLIQGDRWEEARVVCEKSLSICTGPGEDLIPNMFLAKIQVCGKTPDDALKTLAKCLNSVRHLVAPSAQVEPESKNVALASRLAAKVCLHMALIYIDKKSVLAAERYLKTALSYNKIDKDALYHLILVMKSQITTSDKLWERHKDVFNNADQQFTDIALNYLLQTQVTTEQVEKLSVDFLASHPSFLKNFEDMDED